MNYHIVRTNDKLETILNLYNLNVNELTDLNKHISNWNNLIPGTRIKLPIISESLTEELNDIEPFIEDYYPKIDLKRFESFDNNENKVTLEEVEKNQGENIEEKVEINSEEIIYNKEEKDEDTSKSINKKSNFTNTIKLPYNYYYDPYNYYRKRKTK